MQEGNHPLPEALALPIDVPFKEWLKTKITAKRGASSAGHHYIQAYNENKWSFYLRYIRGIVPLHTKPPLIFGGAIHDAKEAFYLYDFSMDACIETFEEVMKDRALEYEDASTHADDLARGRKMLLFFGSSYAERDREKYELIEVEGSHEFRLANGLPVTVRWDLLARDRLTKKYYLFDTKTTGYSIPASYKNVEGGDQATMYMLGVSKIYPELYRNLAGLIPDILYKKGNVTKAERPGVVMRTRNELIEYEQELIGLFNELSQKVEALEGGFQYPHMLFPRNGKDDSMFGSDYPGVYRGVLPRDLERAPPGYRIDTEILENGPYRELLKLKGQNQSWKGTHE